MRKATALLLLYDMIQTKTSFQLKDLMEKMKCSRRTSLRYIGDIRVYLKQYRPGWELVYDGSKRTFVLKEVNPGETGGMN